MSSLSGIESSLTISRYGNTEGGIFKVSSGGENLQPSYARGSSNEFSHGKISRKDEDKKVLLPIIIPLARHSSH